MTATSLYVRSSELARVRPTATAWISPDGRRLTRQHLLDRVDSPAASPSGTDPAGGADTDPLLRVVLGHLAAQARGEHRLILATSGSSATPRVVRRSVRSWMASLPAFDHAVFGTAVAGDGSDSAHHGLLWAPGPAGSTLTLYAAWQGLAAGVPVLATGPWRGLPGREVQPDLDRVSVVQSVPAVLEDVLAARAAGRLPALRTAVVAGAGSPSGMRQRAGALGLRWVEYYGAAELSFVAIDVDGAGLRPFPGVEIALREECSDDDAGVGTLWVRSPYLAEGVADPDGWAGVGDRAAWSADGTLRVLGRAGTASVAGHTVHLAEVEAGLAGVAGVAEVICLTQSRPRVGERVLAVIRREPGADPLPAVRRLVEQWPNPVRPVRIVVRDVLPRTAAGKVARAELAAELAAELSAEPQGGPTS
ncbi:MAG: AMP-binding protein [Kineosporiaceae bacterium]|nr:AMP-binding protein [Kineosporiaceae bacterium]MBK8076688.1 AMP-binding protein [Kineosporiaceae bacterium]